MANQAIEKKTQSPAVMVQKWLNNRSDKLAEWCGDNIDPATLIRVGSRLVAKEEKFQDSRTWPSLYLALITAAQLGLEPDGPRGEAYLIPYWDSKMKCFLVQLQPGYRGLMKLITKSGEIKTIRSQVVHENDTFEMQLGSDKRVDHRPAWKNRGEAVAVYSIASYANGDEDYELASWDDVIQAKNSAKGKSPAWDNWPEQMARKFVIKRHSNQLPLDATARRAVAIDNISSDSAALDAEIIMDIKELGPSPEIEAAPPKDKEKSGLEKKLETRKSNNKAKKQTSKQVKKAEPAANKTKEESPAPAKDALPDLLPDFNQCELCGFQAPKGKDLCEECQSSVTDNEAQE